MFQPIRPIRSLADIEAIEQTPLAELIAPQSTHALFEASARGHGAGAALTFLPTADAPAQRFTYAQLLGKINQTANALHGLGLGSQDTVAIMLPGCAEYHFALWGGEAAAIVQPINPLLTAEKISSLLNATRAKVLIAWADADDAGIWRKVAQLTTGITHVLYVSHAGTVPDTEGIGARVLNFAQVIAREPADRLVSGRVIQPGDIAAYFHTGGTTGSPKLAAQTHGAQVYTAWASVQMQGLTSNDRTINGYPLFHVAGVLPGSLACFSAGAEVIIPTTELFRNKQVLANFWQLVDRHRPTLMSAVPTVLSMLADIDLAGADISSIRYFRTGAAPLSEETARRFKARTGLHVHESLGMTEMTGISTITPSGVHASVGHVGFRTPHARIRIAKMDASGNVTPHAVAPGEAGMVLFRSPNLFAGYLGAIERDSYFTADGWLISGDLGSLSADGLLKLQGRSKDLIIRSGHNVDPQVIEQALERHPAVKACAAVGAPDPHAGEVPVAYVTLKEGHTADAESLREFAARHVDEPPARPRYVEIVAALPTTNVGKVFKPELRSMAKQRYMETALAAVMQRQPQPACVWPQVRFDEAQGFVLRDPHGWLADQDLQTLAQDVKFMGAAVRIEA
ncbi:acyl-CoA synthetase [Acidovorax sp. CCYZU-2555]|uniref:acyl-CoA synthetase n=1 Tax=Acidovorax sp. CCYZU-2555 TaxID=2835042 RepID=UPI001BCD7A50|nr:acyl-CoA synthetase [Acidovorax sp. CCYZU-2555]MBS7780555.1 acyl-CoA synthetase [Acidovorax sp. CCYZU-2555]